MKKDIAAIFEPGHLSYTIKGHDSIKNDCGPEIFVGEDRYILRLDYFKEFPKTTKLRTYFDVNNCRWIVEKRNNQDQVLEKKEFTSLVMDVTQVGIAERQHAKSKISFEILRGDIGFIEEIGSTLIIKRK